MKELYMFAGIGVGMLAGVMLYKYCDSARKIIDSTEKEIIKEVDKIEKDAENKVEEIKEKAKKKLIKK